MKGASLGFSCFLICCFMAYITEVIAQTKVFDVTESGAVSNGKDCSAAFSAAWKAACQFQGSANMLIPQGTFLLGPVDLGGPCYNGVSPSVEINGIMKALADPKVFNDKSWITFHDLNKLTIMGGGTLDGQGASSWPLNTCNKDPSCQLPATTLLFQKVSNSTIFELSLVNSKAFHLNFHQCDHINIHDLNITAPEFSHNTDGIHIGDTDHINITNSVIGTGDDCISIGPGSTNVFVSDVICGPGHGISVGSLGKYKDEMDVIGLHVRNSTITNTSNGLRIKTWPGSSASRASNFTFEDIIMINVSNPIIIDQEYCPVHGCTNEPSKVEISNVMYRRISGTSNTSIAVNMICSKNVPCKHVELQDIILVCMGSNCNTTSSCSNVNGNFSGLQIPALCP